MTEEENETFTVVWYSNKSVEECAYDVKGGNPKNRIKFYTISLN